MEGCIRKGYRASRSPSRVFRESTYHAVFCYHDLTVFVGSIIAMTKLQDSVVQERTVSVLPSRKSRVMEASYVRQNLPMS